MGILTLVANLWHDPKEGETFSGTMTLPQPLPAGVSLRVVAVPKPYRGRKEKWDLHVAIPIEFPEPPPGPEDIIIKGEIMSQFFRPPRPPGKRYKIMLWGESGTAKTKSALEFPKAAYLDNHGSAEPYESAYPDHLFFPPKGVEASPDNTMTAVTSLLRDPGDRLSAVMDDATTYWDQVQVKWSDLFLKRLLRSKGHHAEFYTFQPSDWVHPKREQKALIQRLIALDLNVIVVARAKKEYAGTGDDFMKVVGEIFAGEKNLIYEFDFIFQLNRIGPNQYTATVNKQRVPAGAKPFPEVIEFEIDAEGRSTFFAKFKEHAQAQHFTEPAHAAPDPVKEDIPKLEVPEVLPDPPGAEAIIAGPGNVFTPAPAPAPPALVSEVVSGITEAQLATLKEKKIYYKMSNEEWGKTLLKLYNVNTARDLTEAQADNFIQHLDTQRVPF
jgi:hypothetical protein